jgi:hypothetical protein
LIDSAVLFMADSTVYIAKNLPLSKLVMSVNGHYIMRFWFLLASTAKFQYLRGNSKGCCNDVLSVQQKERLQSSLGIIQRKKLRRAEVDQDQSLIGLRAIPITPTAPTAYPKEPTILIFDNQSLPNFQFEDDFTGANAGNDDDGGHGGGGHIDKDIYGVSDRDQENQENRRLGPYKPNC